MNCDLCWAAPATEQEIDSFVVVKRCSACIEARALPWMVMVGLAANYGPAETERRFPGALDGTCNFYETEEDFLWGEVEENYKDLQRMRGESA